MTTTPPVPAPTDPAVEEERALTDLCDAMVRLVIANPSTAIDDAYEQALFRAAEAAGVDLHSALSTHFAPNDNDLTCMWCETRYAPGDGADEDFCSEECRPAEKAAAESLDDEPASRAIVAIPVGECL